MSRVVFLDYDGVINNKKLVNINGQQIWTTCFPDDCRVNDPEAVARVSRFCEKYGYDIVVSSTWRKYPEWEISLRSSGLSDLVQILGHTSLPTRNREDEITDYLAEHPEIDMYLIFDDAESLQGSSNEILRHLVFCRNGGFGEAEYNIAVQKHLILSR